VLGRKDYTKEELNHARESIDEERKAYKRLAKAVAATSDKKAQAALAAYEPIMAKNMVLALDRPFVHRLRMGTGKDCNPLNEVELLVDSLTNSDGVLRGNNVIKYSADEAVLHLDTGDRIELNAAQFEELADAFLDEIRARFV
jgi:hypothetical protein